jgi:hypothetical protein
MDEDPTIESVAYLKGFDFVISFSNGEDRIIDLSEVFSIPASLKYTFPNKIKDFKFDKYSIWWGNINSRHSLELGNDTLYQHSTSINAAISSYASKVLSVAMATVFKESDVHGRIKGDESEPPHMHMLYKNVWYRVRLEDGVVYSPPNVKDSIKSLLSELAIKHRVKAVSLWNEWNSSRPADPETGKFINRR